MVDGGERKQACWWPGSWLNWLCSCQVLG